MDSKIELRMILIGKSGSGKSGTGNALLGRRAFVSTNNVNPVTATSSIESNERFGIKIKVVDTPGLFDAKRNVDEDIRKSIILSFPGPHLYVLCIKMTKLTTTDEPSLINYQNFFGKNMNDHTIVVFTDLDGWVKDNKGFNLSRFLNVLEEPIRDLACDGHRYFLSEEDDGEKLIETIMNMPCVKPQIHKSPLLEAFHKIVRNGPENV